MNRAPHINDNSSIYTYTGMLDWMSFTTHINPERQIQWIWTKRPRTRVVHKLYRDATPLSQMDKHDMSTTKWSIVHENENGILPFWIVARHRGQMPVDCSCRTNDSDEDSVRLRDVYSGEIRYFHHLFIVYITIYYWIFLILNGLA